MATLFFRRFLFATTMMEAVLSFHCVVKSHRVVPAIIKRNGVNSYCENGKNNKIIIAHMTTMKNDERRNNNINSNRKLPIFFFVFIAIIYS